MKIGIVCYPTLGGSGIVATELGHELALRGHEIHFITYEPPFRLRLDDKNIFFHEVHVHNYEIFKHQDYTLTLAAQIANVSQRYQLDILHVHYAIPHATSAYLAKKILGTYRPRVITTLHGTDITLVGQDPAYYQIVKFSIEQSCGVTAVSKNLCQQIHKYFHINRDIEVIYNFFIPKIQQPEKKFLRAQFVQEDEKLLIHSSNFRPVKRIEDVVKIFMEINKQIKSKLLFVGTGIGLEAIHRMIKELELEKKVFFLGKRACIDPYLASSDLLLLPSSQESFGLTALEAMTYGVPVIATQVGGLPEVVEEGKTGFLSPVGDIQAMASNAIKLLKDPHLYQYLSTNALQVAQEKFNVEKILSQYEEYYQRILYECS